MQEGQQQIAETGAAPWQPLPSPIQIGEDQMSLYADVLEKRDEILRIAAGHGARTVRFFGSAVRGEETPESDIDLLVEFEPGRNLLDHVALVQDLEDLLGRTVDVVTEGGLHWYIRDRIHQEAVPL